MGSLPLFTESTGIQTPYPGLNVGSVSSVGRAQSPFESLVTQFNRDLSTNITWGIIDEQVARSLGNAPADTKRYTRDEAKQILGADPPTWAQTLTRQQIDYILARRADQERLARVADRNWEEARGFGQLPFFLGSLAAGVLDPAALAAGAAVETGLGAVAGAVPLAAKLGRYLPTEKLLAQNPWATKGLQAISKGAAWVNTPQATLSLGSGALRAAGANTLGELATLPLQSRLWQNQELGPMTFEQGAGQLAMAGLGGAGLFSLGRALPALGQVIKESTPAFQKLRSRSSELVSSGAEPPHKALLRAASEALPEDLPAIQQKLSDLSRGIELSPEDTAALRGVLELLPEHEARALLDVGETGAGRRAAEDLLRGLRGATDPIDPELAGLSKQQIREAAETLLQLAPEGSPERETFVKILEAEDSVEVFKKSGLPGANDPKTFDSESKSYQTLLSKRQETYRATVAAEATLQRGITRNQNAETAGGRKWSEAKIEEHRAKVEKLQQELDSLDSQLLEIGSPQAQWVRDMVAGHEDSLKRLVDDYDAILDLRPERAKNAISGKLWGRLVKLKELALNYNLLSDTQLTDPSLAAGEQLDVRLAPEYQAAKLEAPGLTSGEFVAQEIDTLKAEIELAKSLPFFDEKARSYMEELEGLADEAKELSKTLEEAYAEATRCLLENGSGVLLT